MKAIKKNRTVLEKNIKNLLVEWENKNVELTVVKKEIDNIRNSIEITMNDLEKNEYCAESEYNGKIKALLYDKATYRYDVDKLYRYLKEKVSADKLRKMFKLSIETQVVEKLVETGEVSLKDILKYTQVENKTVLKVQKVKS